MFIQVIKGKCSRQAEMRAAFDRWRADRAPSADGWLGHTYGFTDDGTFVAVVRFESEEAARRNSERPEQDEWWQATGALFDGEVEFHDSADVTLLLDGGSDDAGFVQIIRGKVDDPARMRAMLQEDAEMLRDARPEIIGGTVAIEDGGTFIQTVAFTDEAAARAGEEQELPADVAGWEERATVHDLEFMDLREPLFARR